MIAQMLGAAEDELKAAAESAAKSFGDIEASDWAAPYIGYCVEKGIAAGYPDQSFKGSKQITLAEYAALLCRADGDSDSSLGGAWPDNYMESAKDKGFLENLVDCDPAADAQKSLTRGNTAVMTYNCMTAQDSEDPDSGKDDGDDQKPADRLDDFSGRAFGIILETGSTLNKKDEIVGSITFLMGDGVHEDVYKRQIPHYDAAAAAHQQSGRERLYRRGQKTSDPLIFVKVTCGCQRPKGSEPYCREDVYKRQQLH